MDGAPGAGVAIPSPTVKWCSIVSPFQPKPISRASTSTPASKGSSGVKMICPVWEVRSIVRSQSCWLPASWAPSTQSSTIGSSYISM